MIIDSKWELVRSVFDQAFRSCLHFAMATVNEDGSPHVTPIGALILRDDRTGYFFDEYCTRTRDNLDRNPGVCFLAVNADKAFWGKSLADGKFASPPAIRLSGTVQEPREATGDE
ncbi:MAG: pyridoxamine 5'-phosphate oxidase family protein, partial [Dehalococcoidia bacterium]